MFGYVKPDVRELKVKEYELYKSAYCGLCRTMGKRYSFTFKMSLSYDFVFMVLLRLLLQKENVSFSQKRCVAHPAKKRVMMDNNAALEKASDVACIMLYHNIKDKISDNDGIKSFLYRFILPETKRLHKKALKYSGTTELDTFISQKLEELSRLEKERLASVDRPSELFGQVLAESMSHGLDGENAKTAYGIGLHIGRWIYLLDAADDIEKDEKKGNYNPLLCVYGTSEEAKKHGTTLKVSLLSELMQADSELGKIKDGDIGVFNILQNILRLGLPEIHDKIIKEHNYNE